MSKKPETKTISADLPTDIVLTLSELAHAIHMDDHVVIEMVEYELIQPQGDAPANWRFDAINLRRARIAAEFRRDLEINMNGVALALDLLDQIDELQARIQQLEQLLK